MIENSTSMPQSHQSFFNHGLGDFVIRLSLFVIFHNIELEKA
jgi:hypothetical protein